MATRMKIALIRGPFWTPWEYQSFAPLEVSHDITSFVSSPPATLQVSQENLQVIQLRTPDGWVAPLGSSARWFFNGVTSRLLGFSHFLLGLTPALKGFDILHGLETYTTLSFQAARAKRDYGGKLVLTVWETLPHRGETHPLRKARKRFVRDQADAIIAVTERTQDMLMAEGVPRHRIHVIPMGIDLQRFTSAKKDSDLLRTWGVLEGEIVVLCIARLVAEKGVMDLLEAVHQVQRSSQSLRLRLILAGRGPLEARMKHWIYKKGLSKKITLAGGVPYEKIPTLLKSADLFVLPSVPTTFWEEQFGYVLVEAMASGIPVITTRSGAIPHVVGDAASLVSPGNPMALANEIRGILENSALSRTMIEKGLLRTKQLYDAQRVAGRISDLYTSLLR